MKSRAWPSCPAGVVQEADAAVASVMQIIIRRKALRNARRYESSPEQDTRLKFLQRRLLRCSCNRDFCHQFRVI
jgi:hypothetical protein